MKKTKLFALAAGTVAVAMTITGCTSDGGSSSSEGAASDTLYFAGWGGQYQEAIGEAIIKPFEEKYGVKVVQDSPVDYVKIEQMVAAGNITWDVTDNDPFFVNPNCGTLFEEIDQTAIEGLPEDIIAPCAVPIIQYAQVLMYNTETYPDPATAPQSWADFFDTEKFPGTRAVGNYATYGAVEAALLADGVAEDELYPLDFDRAYAKLDTIKDSLVFWDTGAQQEQLLVSGEPDMMIAWSGRAATQVREGATYAPVFNQSIIAYNTLAITKNTKNKELAEKFVAFALEAEQQSRLAELIAYSPANLNATPTLDEIGQQYNVIDQAIQDVSLYQDMNWWGDNLNAGVERWTNWAIG